MYAASAFFSAKIWFLTYRLLFGECLGNLFGHSIYRAIYIMLDAGYAERRVGTSAWRYGTSGKVVYEIDDYDCLLGLNIHAEFDQ